VGHVDGLGWWRLACWFLSRVVTARWQSGVGLRRFRVSGVPDTRWMLWWG
jgi:hypothetical protein